MTVDAVAAGKVRSPTGQTRVNTLDINKYDKHLVSKYIFVSFILQKNYIYMYVFLSFTSEIIEIIKVN